jgi:hypothetical protein
MSTPSSYPLQTQLRRVLHVTAADWGLAPQPRRRTRRVRAHQGAPVRPTGFGFGFAISC